MLGLILRWTQTITRAQGRLLFLAGGVFSFLLVLGLTGLAPRRWRPSVVVGISLLLLAASAAMPWTVIRPAYAMPPRIASQEIPADLARLEVTYGDQIRLIGAQVLSAEAAAGQPVWVRLYWRAEDRLE